MKIVKTGKYTLNDLDILQEIQPIEFAQRTSLKRLNYLLSFIKENKPEILPKFVSNLTAKYNTMIKKDHFESKELDLSEICSNLVNLQEYPKLVASCLNYFIQLLQLSGDVDWIKDKVKIPNKNYIQSFLYLRYYNALVLTETLGRETAIQFYKDYIENYVKDGRSLEATTFENLEVFRESIIQRNLESPGIGWAIVQGKIENGKFPQRKDTCMWDDAINDLPDVELKYLAACYGDFQGYNNRNENFILTMKHTIIEGHPYCDCVVHDIRINNDLRHPTKEFFDNMWPLDEGEGKN
ncbi:MAG: hypothetical protein ACFFCZ_16945 [Promethearchaeota archaeon]